MLLQKIKTISAIALASLIGSAFAQGSPISQAAIEAAKRSAANSATSMSQQQFTYDANGQVVKDAEGKPVLARPSKQGVQDSLKSFQDLTGFKGVKNLSNGGRTGNGWTSSVELDSFFDFSCQGNGGGRTYGASSIYFKIQSCETNPDGSAKSVTFGVCEEAMKGGSCGGETSFSTSVRVAANAYAPLGSVQLGLGCAGSNCRLTAKGTYTLGGAASNLAQSGEQVLAGSDVGQDLRKVVTSEKYSDTLKENARGLAECIEKNKLNEGTNTVEGCSDEAPVKVDMEQANNNGSCTTEPTCLSEALSVSTFERSCQRSFPLTERSQTREYTLKATCELKTYSAAEQGTDSDSCKPAEGEPLNKGMSLVGETPKTCIKNATDAQGVTSCVGWAQTQYWVNVDEFTVLGTSEQPSPVGGACDTSTDNAISSCESEWFGRTLPVSDCSSQYTDDEGNVFTQLWSNGQKEGCGFCLKPKVGQTCYAVPAANNDGAGDVSDSCAGVDLAGCTLKTVEPMTFSGDEGGGLVTAQNEIYSCQREVKQCVKWSASGNDPSCKDTSLTYGTDKIGVKASTLDGSFNQAMVSTAIAESVTQATQEQGEQTVPLLFGGADMRCKRPVGALGSVVAKNCCRTSLERPKKGNLVQSGCDMNEAKLAAARRSSYATYIGDYCSRKLPWPLKSCIERRETYCVFNGILPRLIQEQGRVQLAKMTASSYSADVKRGSMSFNYYGGSEAGAWSNPVEVNGVKVRAWQWPSYCSDPGTAGEKYLATPDAKECPSVVTTVFAACDSQGGCGALPAEPSEGSLDWELMDVDPLKNTTSAISKYAVVTGACSPSTNACTYEVAAWPVGVGGKAVVTKDLNWELYSTEVQSTTGGQSALVYQMNNMGDLMFRMYPASGVIGANEPMPATVRLGFSKDGGQTWRDVMLPTTSLSSSEMTLPGSDVKISGACDQVTNSCAFRATGTATVSAKSWGGPKAPNCSGFTAGQISVLDFSKMDLSEWVNTLLDKAHGFSPAQLGSTAASQLQDFQALYSQGKVAGSPPSSVNFARAIPAEGFGPFNARLVVSGFWPEYSDDDSRNVEKVTSVSVNWGDCSPTELLEPVPVEEGKGFAGNHRFDRPDADAHACLLKAPGDTLQKNLTHKVELKVNTRHIKNGTTATYTRVVTVENAWAKFPGGAGNNDNVTQPIVVDSPAKNIPLPPN